MPFEDVMTDIEPMLILGGIGIGFAALLIMALTMLGLFFELRRMRRASQDIGQRLHMVSEPPRRSKAHRDPIRYAAAAMLATRPDRNVHSEEFAQEFEDLLSEWQQLDSQITQLLDRIDGQDQERRL